MESSDNDLVRELRRAGVSLSAIRAAWPRWWSSAASESPSARAELRFTLARRLGVAPKPFADSNRVEFVWRDSARFKHLRGESEAQKAILAAYGESIAKLLLLTEPQQRFDVPASDIRSAILKSQDYVDLASLLSMCWAVGIPVVHLKVFPLDAKSMAAMVIRYNDRFAILLGRDAQYPAPVAFTLAHELGHIALGHLNNLGILVEVGDPQQDIGQEYDDEESAADKYALELLTGSPAPDIQTNIETFNAAQLADAVLRAGPEYRVEPGTLALCLAFRNNNWAQAQTALKFIYKNPSPIWREVNALAMSQLNVNDADSTDFLLNVLGLSNGE